MRRKKGKSSNTKLAVIFFVLFFFIIFSSLIFKLINVIAQSHFDNYHRFTIAVFNKTAASKDVQVISFSPSSRSISILNLEGETNNLNIYRLLEVPIDAQVVSNSFASTKSGVSSLLSSLFFSSRNTRGDLTIVDLLRLLLFTKNVLPSNIYETRLSVNEDEVARDKISSSLFSDDTILGENVRVQIVNTTNIYGLGNRIARLITNMGGNVVLVSTALDPKRKSVIYYSNKRTYTLERLTEILGFPTIKGTTKSIGDVIIIIGEDGTSIRY